MSGERGSRAAAGLASVRWAGRRPAWPVSLAVVAGIAAWGGGLLAALLAATALVIARRAAHRAAAARAAAGVRAAAEDLLAAFAAELDAGADPSTALRTAAATVSWPAPRPGRAGSPGRGDGESRRVGGERGQSGRRPSDPAGARPTPGVRPGLQPPWPDTLVAALTAESDPTGLLRRSPVLRELRAALLVCQDSGARLAEVATRLAGQARADRQRVAELAAALAGPRASGRLVAGLPVVGVALAALLGADPVQVLLHTPVGSACLVAGVLLDLLGLRWLRWISDRAAGRAHPPLAEPTRAASGADACRAHLAAAVGWASPTAPDEPPGQGSRRPAAARWFARPLPGRPAPPAGLADQPGAARRPAGRSRPARARSVLPPTVGLAAAAVMAAATGVLLGGGQAGLAVPAAVAAVALLAGVLARSDPGRERRARLLGELPMALDLVAACLAAGAPVPGALATTAAGVGGPLGDELTAMAHQLARGVPVATAAAGLLAAATPLPPPRPVVALRRLVLGAPAAGAGQRALLAAVRALDRTEASGARLADTLRRIADRAREQAHAEAIAAARRAGVAAVVPLGLCFLPAFLLIGVVPAVVGILGGLLTA